MKVSLNWLTDYVKVDLPVKALGELFMRIGFNVESIEETDSDVVFDLEVREEVRRHVGSLRGGTSLTAGRVP